MSHNSSTVIHSILEIGSSGPQLLWQWPSRSASWRKRSQHHRSRNHAVESWRNPWIGWNTWQESPILSEKIDGFWFRFSLQANSIEKNFWATWNHSFDCLSFARDQWVWGTPAVWQIYIASQRASTLSNLSILPLSLDLDLTTTQSRRYAFIYA